MRYYIVPDDLAGRLHLTVTRRGSARSGWLCNQRDLSFYGTERAAEEGAVEVDEREAEDFLRRVRELPEEEGNANENESEINEKEEMTDE